MYHGRDSLREQRTTALHKAGPRVEVHRQRVGHLGQPHAVCGFSQQGVPHVLLLCVHTENKVLDDDNSRN